MPDPHKQRIEEPYSLSEGEDCADELLTARIPEQLDGARLDAILGALFPDRSRSFWQNRMEEGHVTCDGRPDRRFR